MCNQLCKLPPHRKHVTTLHCEMHSIENVQKLQEKLTILQFHVGSMNYWYSHGICSKCLPLTGIQAHRCVCHSLIAREVLYFLAGQRCHAVTHRPLNTVWSLEQATPQIISPDQAAPTLTQWTTLSVVSPNYYY